MKCSGMTSFMGYIKCHICNIIIWLGFGDLEKNRNVRYYKNSYNIDMYCNVDNHAKSELQSNSLDPEAENWAKKKSEEAQSRNQKMSAAKGKHQL